MERKAVQQTEDPSEKLKQGQPAHCTAQVNNSGGERVIHILTTNIA